MNDLFGYSEPQNDNYQMSIIPVSVIDLYSQKSPRRSTGNHDSDSSRAEYSPFPEETSRLCFELYLRDCQSVFDPFAGWGERGYYANQYGKQYTGFDINPNAISYALETFNVSNTLADSSVYVIPAFDGLLTCPPYWNLESYSEHGLDYAPTWKAFLHDYRSLFTRVYAAAKRNAVLCIQIGDWRAEGIYYDLAHQTRCLFAELGATTFDDVVISRKQISKIKIMLPQAKRLGYTVKTHEYLLIFKKP